MIKAPIYNTNDYFVVKEEWHYGDPIPHNVKKVFIAQYESRKEDGSVYHFDVPVFILEDAENRLTEQEILRVVDGQYAKTATRLGHTCVYKK